jgi:hypothetical protein
MPQQIGEKGVNLSGGQRQRVSFKFIGDLIQKLTVYRLIWLEPFITMLISSSWTTRYLLVKLALNYVPFATNAIFQS